MRTSSAIPEIPPRLRAPAWAGGGEPAPGRDIPSDPVRLPKAAEPGGRTAARLAAGGLVWLAATMLRAAAMAPFIAVGWLLWEAVR